jgi:hypothetical protein
MKRAVFTVTLQLAKQVGGVVSMCHQTLTSEYFIVHRPRDESDGDDEVGENQFTVTVSLNPVLN